MEDITSHKRIIAAVAASILTIGVSAYASETDDRIEASAKKSYIFETYLKDDSIKVNSEAGVVTLTGTVARDSHKSMAERTLEDMPGVKGVNNRLEVKGESAPENSDAWISSRVTSTLMFHRNVSGDATSVHTKNGHVTLGGVATSAAQKDLTGEYAKDVHGVKDVKNNMTVSKGTKHSDKTVTDKIGEKAGDVKESVDDASTTALVKMTLLYHQSTSAANTTVSTTDGVVTVGGQAKNAAERDLVGKLIGDVHGVKSVVNTMTI